MSQAQVVVEKIETIVYAPVRDESRFVPLETISAILVSDKGLVGHGVVSNISESGACLITNALMDADQEIQVKFSTRKGMELFQTPARIVWSGEGMDRHSEIVGVLVGVMFQTPPDSQGKILEVLERDLFCEVGSVDPNGEAEAQVWCPPINRR